MSVHMNEITISLHPFSVNFQVVTLNIQLTDLQMPLKKAQPKNMFIENLICQASHKIERIALVKFISQCKDHRIV